MLNEKMPSIEDIFSNKEIKSINRWIAIYHSKFLFFLERRAICKFKEFDAIYCQRVGCKQQDLFDYQVAEAKRQASIAFTSTGNSLNETMFNYEESQRVNAYKEFEKRYLDIKRKEEARFPFRVFVATELGLNRRDYLWW